MDSLAMTDIRTRLRRVGLVLLPDGTVALAAQQPPAVDRWTIARLTVWAGLGYIGMDRGTATVIGAVYEIAESQAGRERFDTPANRLADIVASFAGFELGRIARERI